MNRTTWRKLLAAALVMPLFLPALAQDLDDGLIAHWKFDGNFNDSSPAANHAQPYKGAKLSTDRFGNENSAVYFDNNNDYLSFNEISLTDGSYAFWMKAQTDTIDGAVNIFQWSTYGTYNRIFIRGSVQMAMEVNTNGQQYNFYNPKVVMKTWQHVVLVRSGDVVTLYLNGSYHSSVTVAGADELKINRVSNSNNYRRFYGYLDDVRIYDRPLTPGEAQSLFDGPVGVWQANEQVIFSMKKIGIGTQTTGDHKFAVHGSIGTREISVEADSWPDFVFKKDYDLMDLATLKAYVLSRHHLPGVPSEVEVLANGVALGKMNATLLQKVEELTLYLIQQNERIEILEQEVKRLQAEDKSSN